MKLIIDIPEDLYKWIKDVYDNPNGEIAYSAIEKGIPLPKEHGRLVDADILKKHITEIFKIEEKEDKKWALGLKYSLKLIDKAPTVDIWQLRQEATENALKKAEVLYGRPQGRWIRKVDEVGFISHICSECGAEIEVEDCSDDKFCFNCGADMKGDKE